MPNRRTFFQRLAAVPRLGGLAQPALTAKPKGKDYISELGVRTFINAAGTYTTLTASLMPPCFAMGQAAGGAAALAAESREAPRTLDPNKIQTVLRRQGAILE